MRASPTSWPSTRIASWLLSVGFGAVAVAFTSFGPLALLLVVVGVVVLGIRHAGVVGLSGVLTGFGALWTFLTASALASGGGLDNAVGWLVVGLVPAGLGLLLLAANGGRHRRSGPPAA